MGDENPICTLGYYSKPSHEGYRNTIKLPVGNNVVPLRSDTIQLVQTDAHFTDFESRIQTNTLDLDGSTTTWEDLTTRFLAQFFPPGRIKKLRNDILMFQQHHEESLSEAWTHFMDLLQKVPHHGIDHWLQIQIFMIMSLFILSAKLTMPAAANSSIRMPMNPGKSLRTSLFMTMRAGITQIDDSKEIDEPDMEVSVKEAETKIGAKSGAKNKLIKKTKKEEVVEAPSSWRVEYYLKQRINEKLIKGLVDNNRFNYSMSGARVGKINGNTCNVLPMRPVYKAILNKKITKKEDTEGNF
nr:hypothetical protein [Tanacetum cinerariifolium]